MVCEKELRALVEIGIYYQSCLISDYSTTQTLMFPEPPLHSAKFHAFARREIRLWEEIYTDFLAAIPNLLVLHFEVIVFAFLNHLRGWKTAFFDGSLSVLDMKCPTTMPFLH